MELCDKYLHEQIKLNPPLNDYFCFKGYEGLRHIFPNYWSKEYNKSALFSSNGVEKQVISFFSAYSKLLW